MIFSSKLQTNLHTISLFSMQIVYNLTVVNEDGRYVRYEDLCARWAGYCYDNEILRMAELIPSIEAGQINVTYPIYFDPMTFEVGIYVYEINGP